MKVFMLLTSGGPVVIVTSCESPTEPALLKELATKGIEKFIAYEIPVDLAKQRYGGHFAASAGDIHEPDVLHMLDFNGHRAFTLFKFSDLGTPLRYE